jgi:alpha-L-fucosidase 2
MLQSLLAESTLPNMFDTHPPFQIDGNFGAAAAIVEMLVQSDDMQIMLLPALPSAWPDGRVTGLRARGGVKVDIEWRGGTLLNAALTGIAQRKALIRYRERHVTARLTAGQALHLDAHLRLIPT